MHHTDCGMETFQSDAFNNQLRNTFNYQADINFLPIGDRQWSIRDDSTTLRRHPLLNLTIPITGFVHGASINKVLPVSA